MGRFVSNSESGQLISGFPQRFHTHVTTVAEALGIPMDTDFSGTQVVKASEKGAPNGVATLNGSSRVVQLPAAANTAPGPNRIPISDANGKIAAGWLPVNVPNGLAGLDSNSRVQLLPAAASPSPIPGGIPLSGSNSKISRDWLPLGAPSGLATLDANGRVVQPPADAQVAPAPNKIPQANASGKLEQGWLPVVLPASCGRWIPSAGPQVVQAHTTSTLFYPNQAWQTGLTYNAVTGEFTIPSGLAGYYILTGHVVANITSGGNEGASVLVERLSGQTMPPGPEIVQSALWIVVHPNGRSGVASFGVEFLVTSAPVTLRVRVTPSVTCSVHGTLAIHRVFAT